jgi:hypothetical protein
LQQHASPGTPASVDCRVTPLRTTRSQLQHIIWGILYNNFIKFNVHIRLQGYGLLAQRWLTPVIGILRMPIYILKMPISFRANF